MVNIGYNCDIQTQINILHDILKQNSLIYNILNRAQNLGIKYYYISAGCITQTVWNYLTEKDLMYGISDVDFIYYDNSDISYEAENAVIEKVRRVCIYGTVTVSGMI